MYKKFKGNKVFRELVQPERESNLTNTYLRGTRGASIVLKRETFTDPKRFSKK
jgi:hypothetical protein